MKKLFLTLSLSLISSLLFSQNNSDNEIAMQYYQEGSYEKAAVLMEKLFSRTKDEAYFDLYFNSLIRSKQYEEAEKVTRKLSKQHPEQLKYEVALGKTYKERGQQENATKTFNHIISNLPKDEFKIRDLANYFYQIEEYDLALDAFLQGRKVFNNDQIFTFELLNLYRFKKDKNKLIEEFLNVLSTMPQMLQQAETVLSSLFDSNADYLVLQNALFKKIQKDPQNESYAKLLIWQYLQQQEYEMALRQLIAQDKRIKDDGTILFEYASTFVANKAYDTAIKAYTYLLTKGKENALYLPSRLAMTDARYQSLLLGKNETDQATLLAAEYQSILSEYGQNVNTVFAARKWATIQAYYLHNLEKAEEALETALKIPGLSNTNSGELKLELGDIYVLTQQPWDAILLYEQVAKAFEDQPMGNEAKYRSARLSFYQGNFSYAKSQADVLKASTAQLIANDALNLSLLLSDHLENNTDTLALKMYAAAELLQFRNLNTSAIAKLDSIRILYPQNTLSNDILMAKSRIYIKNRDFALAVPLLKELISAREQNIWTDDALFTLAGIYEDQLHDTDQARELYHRLITEFPGSMFTAEARKHYRKLRGDNIES